MHNINTLLPHGCAPLDAAELAGEEFVEAIEVLFGPLDTGARHHGRETLLVNANGVLNETEIDEGDLKYVERKISFKYAGTRRI